MSLLGLTFKRYWRRISEGAGVYHCFRKVDGRYLSLCMRAELDRPHGQDVNRPPSLKRCPLCDGREAARCGVDECLPDNVTHPGRPRH